MRPDPAKQGASPAATAPGVTDGTQDNGSSPSMPALTPPAPAPADDPPGTEDPLADHPGLVEIRELNRRACGQHFLCWHRSTNRQVEARIIPRPQNRTEAEALADQLTDHRTCSDHPHVVALLGVLVEQQSVAILAEPMARGTLADLVSTKAAAASSSAGLSEKNARVLMQQLMVAVEYCHRLGVALYNLRLDNISVSHYPDRPIVKICDFGTSFPAPSAQGGGGAAGPFLQYLGPEFTCNDRDLDMEADVFSCGVILYALLSGGRFPFKRAGEDDTMSTGLRVNLEKWRAVAGKIAPLPQVSPACWHLIKAMLQSEIGERPNAAEVLRHPWMQVDMPPDLLMLNDRLVQAPSAETPGRGAMMEPLSASMPEVITAERLRGDRSEAAAVNVQAS